MFAFTKTWGGTRPGVIQLYVCKRHWEKKKWRLHLNILWTKLTAVCLFVFSSVENQILIWKLLLQAGLMHSRESWSIYLCKFRRQRLLNIFRGAQFALGWCTFHLSFIYTGESHGQSVSLARCFFMPVKCRQTFRTIAKKHSRVLKSVTFFLQTYFFFLLYLDWSEVVTACLWEEKWDFNCGWIMKGLQIFSF